MAVFSTSPVAKSPLAPAPQPPSPFYKNKIFIIVIVVLIIVLMGIWATVLLFKSQPTATVNQNQNINQNANQNVNQPAGLPTGQVSTTNKIFDDTIKAETISYYDYYKKISEKLEINAANYTLPINIKTDVTNYPDVSRKIDLTAAINTIDQNGFAVLDNQFSTASNDFFSLLQNLYSQEIPVFASSDFLIYYYQNVLKETFKNIEQDVFYPALWQLALQLYNNANSRYTSSFRRAGIANDPVVEGQRLVAIYWTTLLEILKPTADQLATGQFDSYNLFNSSLNYRLPEDFKDQINKEVALIREAKKTASSPIFLYQQDYTKYKIPNEFKANEPLKNFYLAMRWTNTLFPLFYKDANCADCLLDKNDWLINFIAANYLSSDLASSQSLKNLWAKIYKVLAFAKGLRSDLNYLNLQDNLVKNYGPDYNLEEIFKDIKPEAIEKFQTDLANNYQFQDIEGTYNRSDASLKPLIGLRLLQEPYWPNDYIFKQLTRPQVTSYTGNIAPRDFKNSKNVTYCSTSLVERCLGLPLDVINLVYSIPETNESFAANTSYDNYIAQSDLIKSQLDKFTPNRWFVNDYWANLVLTQEFLAQDKSSYPIFMQNPTWAGKDLNSAQGAWVNLQLEADIFQNRDVPSTASPTSELNFVEPNENLLSELRAQLEMVTQTLLNIGVISEADSIYNQLASAKFNLDNMAAIIKKELTNEPIDPAEYKNIKNFILGTQATSAAVKNLEINSTSPEVRVSLVENITGVKLLVAVYKKGDNLYLIAGPVFNYQETRK